MSDAQALSARLIGAIFVERGLVTEQQLDEALRIQADSGERLGEILIAELGVPRLELAGVLAEQWADLERDPQIDAVELRAEVAALESRLAALDVGLEERSLEAELEPIRSALGERAARVSGETDLAWRLDEVRGQVDAAGVLPGEFAALRTELTDKIDALARGAARGEDVDELRRALAELRPGDALDGRLGELEGRIEEIRQVVASAEGVDPAPLVDAAEGRLAAALEEERTARSAISSRLDDVLASLRGELEAVSKDVQLESAASRERMGAVEERVSEAASRIELSAFAGDVHARLGEVGRESGNRAELTGLAGDVDARLAQLDERIGSLASSIEAGAGRTATAEDSASAIRDELHDRVSAQDARVSEAVATVQELAGRVSAQDARAAAAEQAAGSLRDELHALVSSHGERVGAAESTAGSLRDELHALVFSHGERVAAAERTAGSLRDELHALVSSHGERVAGAEGAIAAMHEELVRRIDAQETRTAEAEGAASALRQEVGAIDEAVRASRAALEERLAPIVGEIADLVEELRIGRANDVESAAIVSAELVARIDELARDTASQAEHVSREVAGELEALRGRAHEAESELGGVRASVREEVERVATSTGWRLEKLEEAVATDDREKLRRELAAIAGRLDATVALGEEQARASEQAIREGLAALGEKLVAAEREYFQAGSALRRSIERLGAAVVEADARIDGSPLDPPASGFVAFAPTADGYRLIALDGVAPGIGETVEVPGRDAPLVVSRVGSSPLPLDRRACVYLAVSA